MVRRRGVRVTILAEDDKQASLFRRVLLDLGFETREIRVEPIPKSGAGEAWVRKNYARLVRMQRQKSTYQRVALLVGIDADNKTVQERIAQLDDDLTSEGEVPRQPTEALAILVPKRNVETWLEHLQGQAVDEEQDYKQSSGKPDFRKCVQAFVAEYRQFRNSPESLDTLPSLRNAYAELNRALSDQE